MKIKELHIRNIASIEKADINFETDLNDRYSGQPSPIFLISGDTGVGKSVILDSICLAIYKTTPRLEGVVNPMSNNFKTNSGEVVSINSLSQYTRLGISSKDDCFSEVLFVGNDEKEYTARLALGITRGGKQRNPQWTLKGECGEWQRDTDVKLKIEETIGLSFQQFNRMAMLAQGQFSNFLCGDKKEREEILEQLTNTEIFSRYGAAIKSIFDRAKQDEKLAATAFKTESEHIMLQSDVDVLNGQKIDLEREMSDLKKRIGEQERMIERVTKLVDNAARVEKSKAEIVEAKSVMAGEAYQQKKAFVADWNATEQERAQLSLKEQTIGKQGEARTQIARQKERFGVLSSLFSWQEEKNAEGDTWLQQQEEWLQERADRAELYARAGEALVHLGNLKEQNSHLKQAQKNKETEESKTKSLNDSLKQAATHLENAQKLVSDKDEVIHALSQKLSELDVESVNKNLADISKKMMLHQDCVNQLGQQKEQRRKATDLSDEIQEDEKKLTASQDLLDKAKQVYADCKNRYDSALSLYSTMKSGVDETLVSLRQRIRETHADTCPLCGQPLVQEHLDDELFSKILTPLDAERDKAAARLKEAEEAQKHETETWAILQGSVKTKQSSLNSMNKNIAQAEEHIKDMLSAIGIVYDDQVEHSLQAAISRFESCEKQLKEQQQRAESLQKEIQQAIKDKKPLEVAVSTAQKKHNEAEKKVRENAESIRLFTEQMNTAQQEIGHLREILSDMIAPFYPDWQDNIDAAMSALKSDTQEYTERKEKFETFAKRLSESKNVCNQIAEIRQNILDVHADWNLTYLPAKPLQTITAGEWASLSQQVQILYGQMANYDSTIIQCQEIIDAWAAKTGRSEESLRLLRDKKPELDAAIDFVKKADGSLDVAVRVEKEATEAVEKARQELGLQPDEPVPDLNALKDEKRKSEDAYNEKNALYAGVVERLGANKANQERLEKAQLRLDQAKQRYERWNIINKHFGGTHFRTLVQTYILRPLLNNANIYLKKITDRYVLTCSEDNDKLSILVIDRYNKDEKRSATVLSGGEKFMVSLALSLALSSLNKPDMNVNILFIDEGFGTLDEKSLDSVMATLEKLQDIAGQSNRRVGIISHREELIDRIHTQIRISKHGEGRSRVEIVND